MATNAVKIYLNSADLADHNERVYNAGLNRKARRWGFSSIEQCWAVCDLNPEVDRIVTALYSGSAPYYSSKREVSRKEFIRRMRKRWGNKHSKDTLITLYRNYQIVNSDKKGGLPVDKYLR